MYVKYQLDKTEKMILKSIHKSDKLDILVNKYKIENIMWSKKVTYFYLPLNIILGDVMFSGVFRKKNVIHMANWCKHIPLTLW